MGKAGGEQLIPPSMLEGYEVAKRLLAELPVREGPRYHVLRAICFATEAALDVEANRRFYVPGAITAILEKKKYTSWVKYPAPGHRKFSEWIDPLGDDSSFVREVFDLAESLSKERTILDICPEDVRRMRDYVRRAIKVIRKRIPIADFIFLGHHVGSVCDYCESMSSLVSALADPTQMLNERMQYLREFQRILSTGAEMIDEELLKIARRQKNAKRAGNLAREEDADKEMQWRMFCDLEDEYPSVSSRERAVLKKTAHLKNGYKRGGLRRRWARHVRQRR